MPSAVIGGLALLTSKIVAAKTLAIGFTVAFKTFATGALVSFGSSKLFEEFAKKPSRPGVSSAASGVAGSTRGLTGSVIPKRWVLGRARVTGGLVMFRENDREMKAVLVLSAGACDSIERVWAHGDEVEMQRDGNVLTPVNDSKYWGTREVTYTETYQERVPVGGGGSGGDGRDTGPTAPSGGPGRAGACGGCRSSIGSSACAASGPGSQARVASDGQFDDPIFSQRPGSLDMSPWALDRYNDAVSSVASAGAAASDGGIPFIPQPQRVGGGGEGGGREYEQPPARPPRDRGYTLVTRTRTRTRTERVPLVKITEFFDANGEDGQAVADILGPAGEGELEWGPAYRGQDVSYVVAEFFQPDYNDIDDRFWPNIPQMEFLLRGLKVSYPVADETASNGRRLTQPVWTRNAAILRYWYLTERRNVDPLFIDLNAFTSARLLCDENLELTEQSGYHNQYPESVKRYTIDGSITSGDSAAQLDAQFDFAWQGFVVESSGNLIFRPGADMPSRFLTAITEDDIIGEPTISPFGARSDLANEVSMSIEQSSGSEWKEENFVVVDSAAQASDGERLPQELSQMKFVTEPVQAVNLLTQRLRQQRGLVGVQLHLKSPPDWRYHTLIAGDKVELSLPEHGIGVSDESLDSESNASLLRFFRVTGVQVNEDYSVNLNLLEWPDNLFDDEFDFPRRAEKFSYALRPIPAPVGQGSIDWGHDDSGNVFWTAFLSWDPTPYETHISVSSPNSNVERQETRDGSVSFHLTNSGRYTFNLYNRTIDGRRSAQSQVVLDANYDGIPLPKPIIDNARQNGNNIIFQIRNVLNRDIVGLEIRYRLRSFDTEFNDIPNITEEVWEDAPLMSESPLVLTEAGSFLQTSAILPATGAYKIYIRFINRVGRLSPLSDVLTDKFAIEAAQTGSEIYQPQWDGDLDNALVWSHDDASRIYSDPNGLLSNVPMRDWDNESDFPFGEHTGYGVTNTGLGDKTTYTTAPYTFDTVLRREIYVAIESISPEYKPPSDPPGFEITLMHSTSPLDSNGELVNPQSVVVVSGANTILPSVRTVQAVINFHNQRNRALVSTVIGWRNIPA